jgi:tripartite-type tricarboxylate transporter receptor subunit TctC
MFTWLAKLFVGLAVLTSVGVSAQTYPNKPIRWVVPYPPGGGTDALGRIVAERMSERLGVSIVVANVAGGSGTVGSDSVRRAEADGYTLLFNASLFLLGKNVVKSTPYDPLDDFTALGRVGLAPLMVVSSNKVEGTNLADAIKAARANPKGHNMALSGLGSAGHLGTLEFLRLANLDLQLIPYKGTAPGLADVMGGNVQFMIDAMTALVPQVRGGRVRGLAVTSATRSKIAPDVPTTAEASMPELNIVSWYGVWGPKNLPAPIANRLATAIAEVMVQPEFQAKIDAAGILPGYLDPKAFVEFMRADLSKAVSLLKAANFQAE